MARVGIAFSRSKAMFRLIAAAMAVGAGLVGVDTNYQSRGHGEGCRGNKHAKSSHKQNARKEAKKHKRNR